MTSDGFTLSGAPLRRVLSSDPWDYVGTVLLRLDCRHTAVRQASKAPKKRARCGWCRLRALGERKRRSGR